MMYRIFFLDHRSIYLNSLGDALSQRGNQVFYQTSWNMREIEAGIAYFKPDILLTVGCDLPLYGLKEGELAELCRKYNLFHIYWATEDRLFFEQWSVPFIRRIQPDLVWTVHPLCVDEYKALGIPAQFFNFAFNPRMFPAKPAQPNELFDITLIGTTHLHQRTFRYESLRHLLFPLVEGHRDLHIWGYGWEQDRQLIREEFGVQLPPTILHGYLPYKHNYFIYHQSKIVLGVQNALDQLSQRTFEIMGTGAFMIASKTAELSRLFQDGVELVLTESPAQTRELVDYYLDRPSERHQIGQNARKAVVSNHTYEARLNEVWEQLEQMIAARKGGV
ncbi:CgeB family protein [Brevibacillus fulvus]|uniref:Spore maturation protein CgeB n=1 Tax=Brevibacillus fulvus TaxID=1125967 RepID=A0A939BR27_9BACL|nr:glycosyltransferase [Brevibacillus fulvus]MBM7589038.1 spore maturation protein CgeB [Brevibacillus fulvus]